MKNMVLFITGLGLMLGGLESCSSGSSCKGTGNFTCQDGTLFEMDTCGVMRFVQDCPGGKCASKTSCGDGNDACGGACDDVSQVCNPNTKECECADGYPDECLVTLCCKSDWTCDSSGKRCCEPGVNQVCKKDSDDGKYKLFKASWIAYEYESSKEGIS